MTEVESLSRGVTCLDGRWKLAQIGGHSRRPLEDESGKQGAGCRGSKRVCYDAVFLLRLFAIFGRRRSVGLEAPDAGDDPPTTRVNEERNTVCGER